MILTEMLAFPMSNRMKFLLAKKGTMTQVFDEEGRIRPGTLLMVEPNKVILVRTKEKDGYEAVQVASGSKKIEFRTEETVSIKSGDLIEASVFEKGDKILVSGLSKGRGFQGVVKRHGFSGGSRTHGQKHSEREPGSIGGGGRSGGRVVKGMRMAGRMGNKRVTVKNLKVLAVDKENNSILVSGAVPGRKGTFLEIRSVA